MSDSEEYGFSYVYTPENTYLKLELIQSSTVSFYTNM